MSSHYRELVINESAFKRRFSNHGIPFSYSPKLMKYLNPINQGQYYAVGGRSSGGKRSFVDLHFALGTFIWWFNQPVEERPKLKIFYYNMDKSAKQKLQKMLCTYLWIYFQQLMDINTLNGMHSRMFAITPPMESLIEGSEEFFAEFFNILEIKHGSTNPTGIYNDIVSYMKTIGGVHVDGYDRYYEYEPEYHNQVTLVIVDNVKRIKSESRGGVQHSEIELHQKLNEYMKELKDFYKVTPVVIVPSWDVPGVFRMNQMVPDFREFRFYFEDANVVLHLFNPYRFQIDEYNGWTSSEFISQGDKIPRFRVCSILRNTEGGDSAQVPLMFIPENGYFYDLPSLANEQEVNQWIDYCKNFKINHINKANG
jgi:hypothetical protein